VDRVRCNDLVHLAGLENDLWRSAIRFADREGLANLDLSGNRAYSLYICYLLQPRPFRPELLVRLLIPVACLRSKKSPVR